MMWCDKFLDVKAPVTSNVTGGEAGKGANRPGWHPTESLNTFWGWIYTNTGQTMTWKGEESVRGDGSVQEDE